MKKIFLLLLLICPAFLYSQEPEVVHVLVALCDNDNQGIVKVPKAIGNGQNPSGNLYWGCAYGIRTYFKKSADWTEVYNGKVDEIRLERSVFKHKDGEYYIVADAYDGRNIKECTVDLLNSCAGIKKDSLTVDGVNLGIYGNSRVLAYIGHNGLMDFALSNTYRNADGVTRDAIILACASKQYFTPYLQAAKANPLLWTTNLMCPEAYTLYDAIDAYIAGSEPAEVREKAAAAYDKYQKCGINGAKRLLITGF